METKERYFVSILNGSKHCLALGPFTTKGEAEARVDDVWSYCAVTFAESAFYAYGTCKVTSINLPPGKLNEILL